MQYKPGHPQYDKLYAILKTHFTAPSHQAHLDYSRLINIILKEFQ